MPACGEWVAASWGLAAEFSADERLVSLPGETIDAAPNPPGLHAAGPRSPRSPTKTRWWSTTAVPRSGRDAAHRRNSGFALHCRRSNARGLTSQIDPKQPVVAGENISRPLSTADDQVSVISVSVRRTSADGYSHGLWLMAYGHENSPRSGLDDTIDELAILHAPLAKPSNRLP